MNKLGNWNKYYKPAEKDLWLGRVDNAEDFDSFRWHQIMNFIDLSKQQLRPISEREMGFCFLGYCSDEGVKRNKGRPGASKAPLFIRREMSNLPCSFGKGIKLFDAGDINCAKGEMGKSQEELSSAVKKIIFLKLFPIILGGGHDVALGHYNGLAEAIQEYTSDKNFAIGVISFDAHFDLRPYSHGANSGTMFLQIADQCRQEQRSFSCFYLGIQKYGNTVGLFKTAERLKAQYILAKDINDSSLSGIFDKLDKFIKKHKWIYLTICSDVFSSAYAPGVSTPQPFGLHPETVLQLMKHIVQSRKVLSFDIAEVSPRFDEDNRTAKLAAIVIFALINTIIETASTSPGNKFYS